MCGPVPLARRGAAGGRLPSAVQREVWREARQRARAGGGGHRHTRTHGLLSRRPTCVDTSARAVAGCTRTLRARTLAGRAGSWVGAGRRVTAAAARCEGDGVCVWCGPRSQPGHRSAPSRTGTAACRPLACDRPLLALKRPPRNIQRRTLPRARLRSVPRRRRDAAPRRLAACALSRCNASSAPAAASILAPATHHTPVDGCSTTARRCLASCARSWAARQTEGRPSARGHAGCRAAAAAAAAAHLQRAFIDDRCAARRARRQHALGRRPRMPPRPLLECARRRWSETTMPAPSARSQRRGIPHPGPRVARAACEIL